MPRTTQCNVAFIKLLLSQLHQRQIGQVPFCEVMQVDCRAGQSTSRAGHSVLMLWVVEEQLRLQVQTQ